MLDEAFLLEFLLRFNLLAPLLFFKIRSVWKLSCGSNRPGSEQSCLRQENCAHARNEVLLVSTAQRFCRTACGKRDLWRAFLWCACGLVRDGTAVSLQSSSCGVETLVLTLFVGSNSAYTCNCINFAWPLCSCCVAAYWGKGWWSEKSWL